MTNVHSKDDGGIRTKKQFANAILSLSEIMPIQKIRISDICEKCGLKRQSFYYHFKDKYDLIAWLFIQEYGSAAAGHEIINSEDMMLYMLNKLKKNKKFYKNAYMDNSQNSLADYIVNMYVNIEKDVLQKYLHTDFLDPEIVYDIECYSYACVMHTKNWLTDKEKMSAEYFAAQMYRTMPEILKKAYANGK